MKKKSKLSQFILYGLQAIIPTGLLLYIAIHGDYLYIHRLGEFEARAFITYWQLVGLLTIQQVIICILFSLSWHSKVETLDVSDHLINEE